MLVSRRARVCMFVAGKLQKSARTSIADVPTRLWPEQCSTIACVRRAAICHCATDYREDNSTHGHKNVVHASFREARHVWLHRSRPKISLRRVSRPLKSDGVPDASQMQGCRSDSLLCQPDRVRHMQV